jgi:hypothetical protein
MKPHPFLLLALGSSFALAEDWPQFQFNARHSGNAPTHELASEPLGLQAALPMSDGLYTSPVVADGHVYVLDGSGQVRCFDVATLTPRWTFQSQGGAQNVNNISSPAIAGRYLHFGTTAGLYYVLDRDSGQPVKVIDCQEPIYSTPVVGKDRVYLVTLGSQVRMPSLSMAAPFGNGTSSKKSSASMATAGVARPGPPSVRNACSLP